MQILRAATVTVAIAITPFSSLAQATGDSTVQSLLSDCEAPSGSFDSAYCLGVIQGTRNVMGVLCYEIQQGNAGNSALAADVSYITLGAARQAFTNWAKDNPQQWDIHGNLGVIMALRNTFPCD